MSPTAAISTLQYNSSNFIDPEFKDAAKDFDFPESGAITLNDGQFRTFYVTVGGKQKPITIYQRMSGQL